MVMGTTMGYEPSLNGVFEYGWFRRFNKLYVVHTSSREYSYTIRDGLRLVFSIVKGIIVVKGVGYLHLMTAPRY